MDGFYRLHVYQESLILLKKVYLLLQTEKLRHDFSLRDQIKRASMSITANIAEGYGRHTTKDKFHFLTISIGSTNEVMAFLDIIETIYDINISELRNEFMILGKKIYKFRSVIR